MEINSNKIASSELQKVSQKEENNQTDAYSKQVNDADLDYPNSSTLKAYANIKPKEKTVSKEELVNFIHSTGCKFEQRVEEFTENATDSDGFIKQETFDWIKDGYNETKNLFVIFHIVNNAKEKEKINHKVLDVIKPALANAKSSGSYGISILGNIPQYFEDKEGNFNNDLLDIIKETSGNTPQFLTRRPDHYKFFYFTKNNEFDIPAIKYSLEQKKLGKENKEIETEIGFSKDEEGKFNEDRLHIYNELKSENMEMWQIRLAQELSKNAKNKSEFLELAKEMKTDLELKDVLQQIQEIKSNEDDKTGIEYDKTSVDFIKELKKESFGHFIMIPDIVSKINIPIKDYTPENINTIRRMYSLVWRNEDIIPLLDASINKAGENKGQFSFDNLNKYLDIYSSSMKDIETVKKIAGNLSLETDDYALGVISKLYSLSWEKDTPFGKTQEKLNQSMLSFILDLCVKGHNGVPKRKAYRPPLENIEKLMSMELPMKSRGSFENFIIVPEFDVIERLDKIGLDEIGIKAEQYTHGKFKTATEEELFAFKDYMKDYLKDKDPKYINVNLNSNLKNVIEIKNDSNYTSKITMYDMVKRKPTTEVSETHGLYNVQREQRNFENNLVTKQLFRKVSVDYERFERLESQTTEKYDDNGKLLWTEEMKQSPIKGVFNVTKYYSDGRVEELVKAEKLPNGNDFVRKNLTSFDGTKTEYYYEDDINGNRIMDYKITSPNGKVLMNYSNTFEVIDDNHFYSSRNNKKYDIKFSEKTIEITDLSTKEKVEIDVENFTKSTQKKIIPLLKRIPGDELFMMKKLDLKHLSNDNSVANASYRVPNTNDANDTGEILIKEEYLDDAVLLHEWGHGKDHIEFKEISEEINKDPKLKEIYNREKALFRQNFSDAQLSHIAYFGADMHYLGSDNAIQEGIAETNAILSVLPKNEISEIRAHYWMQYFPNTISYLSKLLH